MVPYKAKTKTVTEGMTTLKPEWRGFQVTIQAVYYGSKNPSAHLTIHDAEGDQCVFSLPGQLNATVTALETPVTVKLPLKYIDNEGGNDLIVFGQAEKIAL
jgi:hypothetical protein